MIYDYYKYIGPYTSHCLSVDMVWVNKAYQLMPHLVFNKKYVGKSIIIS